MRAGTLLAIALLVASHDALAQNDPKHWVYFDSRETPRGPELAIVNAGYETVLDCEADLALISYLADGNYGVLERISLSLGDTNRVLLRFSLDGIASVQHAELRLAMHPSGIPPVEPFDLAVHAIEEEWSEHDATWNDQPAFAKEPAATIRVVPERGDLRIDVTELVKAWLSDRSSAHGFCLRPLDPLGPAPAPVSSGPDGTPTRDALQLAAQVISYEASLDTAFERAREEARPVLGIVTAAWNEDSPNAHEKLLLRTVLTHPAVRELIEHRFAAVRIVYSPQMFANSREADVRLERLGTKLHAAKAPALVVARPDGTHFGTMQSIGTFDHGMVYRFLLDALGDMEDAPSRWLVDPNELLRAGWLDAALAAFGESGQRTYGESLVLERRGRYAEALDAAHRAIAAGGPAALLARVQAGVCLMRLGRNTEAIEMLRSALDGHNARTTEAKYWLAALLDQRSDEDEARELLSSVMGDSASDPFALKALIRQASMEELLVTECLASPLFADVASGTEVLVKPPARPDVIAAAVDYLLDGQRWTHGWLINGDNASTARPAVTILAAHALLVWQDRLEGERATRAREACARAEHYLKERWSTGGDDTDSFAAAYYLDYVLERYTRNLASEKDVQSAITILCDGQLESGAWSYNKRFGNTWKGGFGGWPVTEKGRAHSMNTGMALAPLARASRAGFEVPEGVLERGLDALDAMRVGTGQYTYTWPEPRSYEGAASSIARAPVCELARMRLGASDADELEATLDLFIKHRVGLRLPVKLTESWLPPHGYSSYFYFYAYYHAAVALTELRGPRAKRDLEKLTADLFAVVEADGTWVDYEAIGKPYATAMALLVLDMAERQ